MNISAEQRFWNKVQKRPGGCWVWTASRIRDGYGRFNDGTRHVLAHRYAYALAHGNLPPYPQNELDHLCRNRACVNPAHLEAVTAQENIRRGAQAQTHCPNGHLMDAANTRIRPSGHRSCRRCAADASRRYRARRREVLA